MRKKIIGVLMLLLVTQIFFTKQCIAQSPWEVQFDNDEIKRYTGSYVLYDDEYRLIKTVKVKVFRDSFTIDGIQVEEYLKRHIQKSKYLNKISGGSPRNIISYRSENYKDNSQLARNIIYDISIDIASSVSKYDEYAVAVKLLDTKMSISDAKEYFGMDEWDIYAFILIPVIDH